MELRVADIYRQLGAQKVETNLRLSGQQLDVYVELPSPDGLVSKIGIDCKNYAANVGVNEVNASAQKLAHLRQTTDIDIPVLLAAIGFTPEARVAAQALAVKTVILADLARQVADFTDYLTTEVRRYKATDIFNRGLYRTLGCESESGRVFGPIDRFLRSSFSSGKNFVTILGDYGTGKTTFAGRLFYESALAHLARPLKERIPLLVPLKRYRKAVNIRGLLIDLLLHEYRVRIRDYGVFRSLNEAGRLLIILDAFDEMATGADEAEIISNFREIRSLQCKRAQVVLTCRTHFFKDQGQLKKVHCGTTLYEELQSEDKTWTLCFLQPFTKDDVVAVVRAYSPDNAENYLDTIERTYNLRELCRHPILLDMILKTVPDVLLRQQLMTPSDLYRTYTCYWLDRDDWRSKMTHDQREFFMNELAFYFQCNGVTEIHFRNLPRHIRRHFPGLRSMRDLDYFEADVRTCSFLVRDQSGNYSFSHRSFSEYFAARCAVDHMLAEKWPEETWRGKPRNPDCWVTPETARFAIEILGDSGLRRMVDIASETDDGPLLLNTLAIYRHAAPRTREVLFDVAHWRAEHGLVDRMEFKKTIAGIARQYHGRGWADIERVYEEWLKKKKGGGGGGALGDLIRTALHRAQSAGHDA